MVDFDRLLLLDNPRPRFQFFGSGDPGAEFILVPLLNFGSALR
ncbi:MAG: hypothetical protein ABSF15_29640 [Candidatus Sulfotelmatobacter sp.]|jgi:hypothetical protein